MIKEAGARAGVVLNPGTPIYSIEWVAEYVDLVLVMSVNPGFGGQHFIENSLEKIRMLRKLLQDRNLSALIEVDGGVNEKTIEKISLAGADVFVAGSAIFGSSDYKETVAGFKKQIGN
jgi:ribulose-phosphate 3-epimerase